MAHPVVNAAAGALGVAHPVTGLASGAAFMGAYPLVSAWRRAGLGSAIEGAYPALTGQTVASPAPEAVRQALRALALGQASSGFGAP
jgi:hypothetical protein